VCIPRPASFLESILPIPHLQPRPHLFGRNLLERLATDGCVEVFLRERMQHVSLICRQENRLIGARNLHLGCQGCARWGLADEPNVGLPERMRFSRHGQPDLKAVPCPIVRKQLNGSFAGAPYEADELFGLDGRAVGEREVDILCTVWMR
jgi:hypothetical protein